MKLMENPVTETVHAVQGTRRSKVLRSIHNREKSTVIHKRVIVVQGVEYSSQSNSALLWENLSHLQGKNHFSKLCRSKEEKCERGTSRYFNIRVT
ncbi:hypothetical protein PoB_004127600 [Plakobranchus ocellatus]|uniref:Uncharacterized protein n=1 Tax=Plakobranchus ocellatus TaxID=259542 RepID=A0AAV4AUL5_9GAST|nr:hypothetical protein PoB_004127600 [Plakobranchus ocellatus]